LRNAARRLLSLFPDRQLTILNLISNDNCVALELEWKGIPVATIGAFKMGSVVQYRVASFLTFADGLIIKQVDYCVQF
jgi:predicted ester cyclase